MKILINVISVIFIILTHISTIGNFGGALGFVGFIVYTIPVSLAWIFSMISYNIGFEKSVSFWVLSTLSSILCTLVFNLLYQEESGFSLAPLLILIGFNIGLIVVFIVKKSQRK